MAETRLADVIVPEVFNPYVLQKALRLNRFFQSGILADMSALPEVNEQMMGSDPNMAGGGKTVQMPFWNDLTGDSEVLDDTANLTVAGITAGQDTAVKLLRGRAFGASDLSGELAGSDPMLIIGDRIANYWATESEKALFSVLNGAMGTTKAGGSMVDNTLNISAASGAAAYFDAEAFIDACHKLGDRNSLLQGIAAHSDTVKAMKKLDLIDFIEPSTGGDPIPIYQGKRVIEDDSCPVASGGIYTTYVFGNGAVGYATAPPKVPSEIERNALIGGGQEYLVTRWKAMLHIRGIKWDPASGVPAKPTPSNTELAGAANWARVYEAKHVRVVRFIHKLAP
jgi:hypothetical protein